MRHTPILWLAYVIVFASHALPQAHTPVEWLFACLQVCTQATLLSLPLLLLELVSRRVGQGPWQRPVAGALALVAIASLALLYANYTIAGLFGFYIDPFVINILTTPGGVEALGAADSFYRSVVLKLVLIALAYLLALRFIPFERLAGRAPRPPVLAAVVAACFLVQSAIYAVAEYQSESGILAVADTVPWYPQVTAKSLLEDLGVSRPRVSSDLESAPQTRNARFNVVLPELPPAARRYNIVWLVAESWRWDMLTPEVMPLTWQFARSAQRFDNHYSSGNGTRMGIFGQFYGLTGQLWFPALRYHKSPAMLDVLQQSGYRIHASTSASFSYPEFDRTVWLNVPEQDLVSDHEGERWQRDRRNVDGLLDFMNTTSEPYLAFMFFETTHANYSFPAASELRQDYLEDFNYLDGMSTETVPLVKNRYINASHYLDTQFARILDNLEQSGHLDDTIVVITGDHGEEFMEAGHWGHNSTFSRQQIRVPMVIYVPGETGSVHSGMSSHLDLPATLLQILNPQADLSTFSMGADMLAEDFTRDYVVVSDWHGDALVTGEYVLSLSAKANARRSPLTNLAGIPISAAEFPASIKRALESYLSLSMRLTTPPRANDKSL